MSKRTDRLRLCRQCVHEIEMPSRDYVGIGIGERAQVLAWIDHRIMWRRRWENPLFILFRRNQNLVIDKFKLCPGCSYVLEHCILAQEQIGENKK